MRQSPWMKIIGEDYVAKAFEFAHEADPNAELYYNDFSLENAPKRAGAVRLIAMLALTGGMINGVQTTMYALAAHVYPSAVRATGVGTAVAVGRFGAILTGYVGPWAIELRGTTSFFAVIAVTMVVTFVALASVKRHVVARI